MENYIYGKDFELEKFAEGLAAAARENVKWERRKLEWVEAEQKAEARRAKAAAKLKQGEQTA